MTVLEFRNRGFDFLGVRGVEGDVTGGERLQGGGFNAGLFCCVGEWLSSFDSGLDFFSGFGGGELEFFVGALGFQGLGEAFFGFVEGHFSGGLGFDEIEDEVGFITDDGVAGGLRIGKLEGGGDGTGGLAELFSGFAEGEGFGGLQFEICVFGKGFEVGFLAAGLATELAGLVGKFLERFAHVFPGQLFLFVGEIELNEADFPFFGCFEGRFALVVRFFDIVVGDGDILREIVARESDDGCINLLMVSRVGLHEFRFGWLGRGTQKIFDAGDADAVADEFFKVFLGHSSRSEGHLHVEFVSIVIELPLVLECREFLDGVEDLLFCGGDAELIGFLAEYDGVPDERIGAVLRGIGTGG